MRRMTYMQIWHDVRETRYVSTSLLQEKYGLNHDEAEELREKLMIDNCEWEMFSYGVMKEFMDLRKDRSDKEALEFMIDKAIDSCDDYNDYADGVSELCIFSMLMEKKEIEERILSLLKPRFFSNSGEDDEEFHNKRIRFSLHLLNAYCWPADEFYLSESFTKQLVRQMAENICFSSVRESVIEYLAYLLYYGGDYFKEMMKSEKESGPFYSAAVDNLQSSWKGSHSSVCLLAGLPVIADRKDQRLRDREEQIWTEFLEASDLETEMFWMKILLHADPAYDWQNDKKDRRKAISRKAEDARGIRRLMLLEVSSVFCGSEFEFSNDSKIKDMDEERNMFRQKESLFALRYFNHYPCNFQFFYGVEDELRELIGCKGFRKGGIHD